MHVLLLSWDASGRSAGPTGQAAGLATALAAAGHGVHVVSRSVGRAGRRTDVGPLVELVADAPPIIPPSLADPVLSALAFAGRATSAAVRHLEAGAVDVVHAEGWQAGPVVAALRRTHGLPVVATVEPWELSDQHPGVAELAAALVDEADVRLQRGAAPARGGRRLPLGVSTPARRPGPPPARGAVLLVPPPDAVHRAVAGELRRRLRRPRRISRSWHRRPLVVAVLDPHALDAAARALAAGVPIITVAGPVGELVRSAGAGVVVDGTVAAVAAAIDRLVTVPTRAAALGAAATDAGRARAWPHVVEAWTAAAGTARDRAAGRGLSSVR